MKAPIKSFTGSAKITPELGVVKTRVEIAEVIWGTGLLHYASMLAESSEDTIQTAGWEAIKRGHLREEADRLYIDAGMRAKQELEREIKEILETFSMIIALAFISPEPWAKIKEIHQDLLAQSETLRQQWLPSDNQD